MTRKTLRVKTRTQTTKSPRTVPPSSGSYANLAAFLAAQGCASAGEFGRRLYKYTDCGPWTVFVVPEEPRARVYYDAARAHQSDWWERCTGIQIGSIVEGSDVEIGPIELNFPFGELELDEAVKAINDEAAFYWKRDNATYFTVLDQDENVILSAQWVEFDESPEGGYPEELAALAKLAGETLLNGAGLSGGDRLPIPGTAYFVCEDEAPDLLY